MSRARNDADFSSRVVDDAWYFQWQEEKVQLILEILRQDPVSGLIGDVGCFTGAATSLYCNAGFDRAVGFDLSRNALKKAEERGVEGRLWAAGEEACPAVDEEFHTIVAADVIEHIVDTDGFLREIHRVLRSDGRAIISTPNLAFWLSRLRLLMGKPPWSYPGTSFTVKRDAQIDLSHIRVSTVSEWTALFEASGFSVDGIYGWSILSAIHSPSFGVRFRRAVDRRLTRFPELAFGLVFRLRKCSVAIAGEVAAGSECDSA